MKWPRQRTRRCGGRRSVALADELGVYRAAASCSGSPRVRRRASGATSRWMAGGPGTRDLPTPDRRLLVALQLGSFFLRGAGDRARRGWFSENSAGSASRSTKRKTQNTTKLNITTVRPPGLALVRAEAAQKRMDIVALAVSRGLVAFLIFHRSILWNGDHNGASSTAWPARIREFRPPSSVIDPTRKSHSPTTGVSAGCDGLLPLFGAKPGAPAARLLITTCWTIVLYFLAFAGTPACELKTLFRACYAGPVAISAAVAAHITPWEPRVSAIVDFCGAGRPNKHRDSCSCDRAGATPECLGYLRDATVRSAAVVGGAGLRIVDGARRRVGA